MQPFHTVVLLSLFTFLVWMPSGNMTFKVFVFIWPVGVDAAATSASTWSHYITVITCDVMACVCVWVGVCVKSSLLRVFGPLPRESPEIVKKKKKKAKSNSLRTSDHSSPTFPLQRFHRGGPRYHGDLITPVRSLSARPFMMKSVSLSPARVQMCRGERHSRGCWYPPSQSYTCFLLWRKFPQMSFS